MSSTEQSRTPVSTHIATTLRLCVQEPSDATRQTVSAALVATTDWSTLVRVAMEHRVVGYVARAAAECDVELPHGVQQTLRHLTLVKTGEGLRMELHLRRVASAFQDAAIPMIVLKGPALSRTLYPEIGLRPYADLDLTIRDQDEQSAVDVLEAEGFHEIVDPFENARRPHRSEEGHEGHFHRRFENADGVLVELHLDPLQLGLKTVCEDGRWSRAESLPGVPGALMLGPEDQVVQLSVHAHKHGFERLIWLKDLDLLLRRHAGSLNWGLIQDVARAEGVAGSVWYALWLTRKLLNTPLRDRELRALQPAMPVRVAYHWVWPVRSVARLQARMHRRAVQFRAADSLRGMLPATLLMGRRWARTRALVDVALG